VSDAATPSQFIGRAEELARLDAALARASDGFGGVAIVGGEAGIGKTWLLERFAAGCREGGGQVLIGGCLEFTGVGVPFAPFVEIVRSLVAAAEPARLPALLGPGRQDLERLVPEIAGRHNDRLEGDLDPSAQARLFEAVLGVFERIGHAAPAVVIVEDVQWADEDTRDLLTFLVRHLRATRILVILSLRTDSVDSRGPTSRFIGELERDDGVFRIELGAFGRRDLRALLASHTARPVSGDWLDEVLARSGGNPFYALRLLDMLDDGEPELPARLRDVLLMQLGGLSPVGREVVRSAAAAGMTFDDDLLAAATGAARQDIATGLREAIASGLLIAAGSSADSESYTFRHALVREVADAELLAGERVRLHAGFASALLDRRRRGLRVTDSAIAFHLEGAGDDRRAVPALVLAGAEAERAFAFAVARGRYERALELWDGLDLAGNNAQNDRPAVMQRAAECAVLTGSYHQAIELGRKAIASLEGEQPRDADRLGGLHERLRWYLWEAGDDAGAEAEVTEALRLIPAAPPSAARARVLGQAAGLRMYAGNQRAAIELASEAISIAVAAGASGEEAFARGILGWCQALAGNVEAGVSTYRSGLAIAERLGGAEGVALGHENYAALLDRVGRTEASLAAALEGVSIVRRLGVSRTYGGMLLGHATKALFDLGRWDEAVSVADEGLDLDPVGLSAIWLHVNHARLDTNRGRFHDAADHLRRARALEPTVGRSRTYEIALLAAHADLARWERTIEAVRSAIESGAALIAAGRPLDPALGWLAATGLRAEADAAVAARARHDAAALADALEHGRKIAEISRRLATVPAWSADGRHEAILAQCQAELGRMRRTSAASGPAAWQAVGLRWEELRRPYPAAYAWFRAAEVELERRGSRDQARELLRRAHEITDQLGAVPLNAEIERLARHARIDLGASSTQEVSELDRLGLTKRELEVIQLVAAGWSNRQIADALFITRKTASVHVSNIMAKVGASNRGEAAAVAHQLGLAGDVRVAGA